MPLYFVYKIEYNCINTDKPIMCFRRFKDAIEYCNLYESEGNELFIERFSIKRGYLNDDARCCLCKNYTANCVK